LEKSEFPVSPETENSHWLKGDKNVITLTTAYHDCMQARFVACSAQLSSLTRVVTRNGAVYFKMESCSEKFQHFFAQI